MRHRSLVVLSATVAAGALTLTACGSRGSDGKSGADSSSGSTVVTIGVDAPISGDLSALGLGIRNSVDLAVRQANEQKVVPGVTFKIKALDDQAQPSSGQQNATQLVGDKTVLGVVGPLNSGVAQSMQKVFDNAHLVEISPANTSPDLTQGDKWASGEKVRKFKSYFRTATTDAIQGPFGAQYAYNDAKKTKVFLVDDKQTYGAGLVAAFKDEFTKLGGKVVGQDHVNTKQKDFSSVVTKIKSSGADIVYYGGQYPESGPLSGQLKKAGAKIPVMGGDGIYDPKYIELATNLADGDLATSVGAPVESLDSAKKFVADYKAQGYSEPYAAYGGYSYDSAWAIVEAVKAVVDANGGKLPADARAKVVDAMSTISFDGVTGKVSFDEFGDATNKQLTVYVVKDNAWTVAKTGTFTG
ncbi:branched-chain amino acid ABC transporter substrate-binding protein [Peterkaempfera bronchialis]|uniref:Branched-chain amino acid ABC transporter substrate-binding protein n=1 Tax=Peterkaempfera bronchialis TaxID=2126346 RepID=A0A345STH0_9ACTN|nr:branched-chain amino acid ABC transporter substrate-binding protein [Peterkaempfera bronchialis]AXI77025.1 branched-chain amino acid ABC transporter substrate-binding protein [Peterkaempfera bronchialis]